jgi:hypothetical protein
LANEQSERDQQCNEFESNDDSNRQYVPGVDGDPTDGQNDDTNNYEQIPGENVSDSSVSGLAFASHSSQSGAHHDR